MTVPRGGARWEMVIGVVDAPATVRVGRVGAAPSETHASAGAWTRVALDLDLADGPTQSVAVDVEVAPGGVAAWSSELVTPLHQHQNRPDIILISLDTVRRDQLTPYSPGLPTTPALDTFVRDAVKFEQAVSTSSWTIASHAALFTGHFPADSLGYKAGVGPDELTLPESSLRAATEPSECRAVLIPIPGGDCTRDSTSMSCPGSERTLMKRPRGQSSGWRRPVRTRCLCSSTTSTHTNRSSFRPGSTRDGSDGRRVQRDVARRRRSAQSMTAAVRLRLLRAYRAELSAIDKELGRLFDYMQRNGRWASTLVIVWGDHGQLLGERGNMGMPYTLDEELLRVPLIIKPPHRRSDPPGVYRHPIQSDDLFALCQTLGGLPNREGGEIAEAIRADIPFRRLTYSKIHHDPLPLLMANPRWRSATQWAVSDGQMKIVRDLEDAQSRSSFPGPKSGLSRCLPGTPSWCRRSSAFSAGVTGRNGCRQQDSYQLRRSSACAPWATFVEQRP